MRKRLVRKRLAAAAFAATLIAAAPAVATEVDSFRQIANMNVPEGIAEIVSATPDGETLFYTDAAGRAVGVVDVATASEPVQVARIPVPGEPTSVAFTQDGGRALVAVNTSLKEEGAPPEITPGLLVVIDVASRVIVDEIPIGDGPDSVAVTRIDGSDVAVVAIENEPVVVDGDGNLTGGEDPGLPGDISGPGLVQVVALAAGGARVIDVPLAPLAGDLLFPDDPQPEFVSIRGTTAAVTVQENNGIALIDLEAALAGTGGVLVRAFSAGRAGDRPADLTADATISFSERFPSEALEDEPNAGIRTPDAIAWSADGKTLYTADEGEHDLTGGRGWSAHDPRTGRPIWEDTSLERTAARFGHYPDERSDAKGIEIEGLATATIGGRDWAFVGSERGSFVAVHDLSRPRSPRFVQLLPTGVEPEGILAIPSRKLLVTASELTGNLTIFKGVAAKPAGTLARPQISSRSPAGAWAALSGLAADPVRASVLWSVPDDALASELYRIEVKGGTAGLAATPIRKDGELARYDLEGIAVDRSAAAKRSGGFWLAGEGNAAFGEDGYLPNLLVQVDRRGNVLREVPLPPEVDSAVAGVVRSNGFEGVTVSDDGRHLLAAIQRDYSADAAVGGVRHTRIARYDLLAGTWDFFLHPLDAPPPGASWVALSEITNLGGDRYAVIERDDLAGAAAAVKRVYEFTVDGLTPTDGSPLAAGADLVGAVIEKTLLRDVLEESAPFEKVEGLTLAKDGRLWSVIDNDGGLHESRLSDLGQIE